MIKAFLGALFLSLPLFSAAGTMAEDMHWFRSALKFSNFKDQDLEKFYQLNVGKDEYRLSQKFAPWAGNYFPMAKGGVAQRWQNCANGQCEILDRDKVKELTKEQIAHLSPIEKYDILLGDYEFNATRHELVNRGPLRDLKPEYWEGFCNGVRCAGLLQAEPKRAVTLENPDGIKIKFEPSDIKALLGANYFYVEKYAQLGGPTQEGLGTSQPNAAVFDIALRYHVGHLKKGFVIDSHLGPEIWNETVVGYKREVSSPMNLTPEELSLYSSADKKVLVSIVLETLGEVSIQDTNSPTKGRVAKGDFLEPLSTQYELFLDKTGNVIDGRWIQQGQKTRGVDFAWFARGKGADDKYSHVGGNPHLKFRYLTRILRSSRNMRCSSILN
jgi:hypothetical protein